MPKEASPVKDKKFPVEFVFYDDQSDPQLSAKLVEKLVKEDKVDLLLGGFGSSQVMAASAASERLKYPMVCGSASSNALFTRGFKYYFSTLGKATEEVRGLVEVFNRGPAQAQDPGHRGRQHPLYGAVRGRI